jgi:hypothetical protein
MSYAQDTYDAARFASSDLNGTARYVGMGGVLSALGGDISVMSSNPAGTALFRKSEASLTLGVVIVVGLTALTVRAVLSAVSCTISGTCLVTVFIIRLIGIPILFLLIFFLSLYL